MTPAEAANAMDTARTYKVQEKDTMNGDTLSIVDTLAKNINDSSANDERADTLLREVAVKLPARVDSYRTNGDTLPVADEAHLLDNGARLCGECYRPGEDNGIRYDVEPVDCPAHCEECEALLPLELTPHGYDYVARELSMYLEEPSKHDRPRVLRTWAIYYDHGRSIVEVIARYWVGETDSQVRELVRALMEARGIF